MGLGRKNTQKDFLATQKANHKETIKKKDELPKVKANSKAKNEHPRQN